MRREEAFWDFKGSHKGFQDSGRGSKRCYLAVSLPVRHELFVGEVDAV